MLRDRPERRKKQRIQLAHAVVARYGAMGAVLLDVTDAGARIEHFTRLDVGKRSQLRFEWTGKLIEVDASVVSCKVHRFAHGDEGMTVYQSGLFFTGYVGDSLTALREMVSTIVSRSLAEQVANARGIGPVTERNMPVFRSGVVATNGFDVSAEDSSHFVQQSNVGVDRGYTRCTLVNDRRWDIKWSRSPEQPAEGFTVRATEPAENVEQLCESYAKADAEQRQLIRVMAAASVDYNQETAEPVG